MFSLMSFPDNYGDQTGLGTTDFEPHAYNRETNFLMWIKTKTKTKTNPNVVAMTLGLRNLPSIKI